MQSEAMWGYLPLAGERSGAMTDAGDDAERIDVGVTPACGGEERRYD
jgi:hypothetical protein